MVDIIDDFESWLNEGAPFVMATVIQTWRSAPRQEGAAMLVSSQGTMVGSVSGGCVEASVVKAAQQMLQDDQTPRRLSYGVTDEDAWSVGLSCGGQIEIWMETISEGDMWKELVKQIKSGTGCVLVSGLEEKENFKALYTDSGGIESEHLARLTKQAYHQHKTQINEGYFLNVFPAKSRLIIIGAAHVTLDLIKLANLYNFETIVIDPRGIFAKEERFGIQPDQLINDWPAEVLPDINLDADTYVVVLTHDPKIDDQALKIVLDTDVAYVGALGSRKTHAKRTLRLKEDGVPEEKIERIYGPVGLNINARQPAEIALSIMAQIIGVRNQYL
jgi:xanthine dehydrogenase accessory factor